MIEADHHQIVIPECFYRGSGKYKNWIPARNHCGNDGVK